MLAGAASPASAAPSGAPFAARGATDDVTAQIARQAKGQLKKFYAGRAFAPLWAQDGIIGPEADTLLAFLASADLDGLKPSSYKLADLARAIDAARDGDPRSVARAELRLSNAFARYARDTRKPSNVGMIWLDPALEPKKPTADAVLRAASLPASFADYITAMGWMSPHYVELRSVLARAALNGADDETLRRIRLNRDRARVLPGPWTHHVVVDANAARLWYYQAGKAKGTMRVVVGRPETPTPMLAGMLQYAILNPYWNVPVDLVQTLVAPRVLAGRSLKSMGFEALSDWSAAPQRLDPKAIDWPAVAAGAQEIRLRQLPGPANSMGRVKFMFPNDDGIYLHDTPERGLFAKADRHLSNGCIRLEDAAALGRWLLGRSIRSTSRAPEQAVPLTTPVPIYLTYLTVSDTGAAAKTGADVYGRDR